MQEARNSGLNTSGNDVHPFLAAGLLGGVPFMILICILICYLYRRYRLVQKAPHDWVVIAFASTILYVLVLAFLNTYALFTSQKDMVPFLIITGLFLSSEVVGSHKPLSLS
jgi:energy-coupling factor transporter transmembrane protein EcfT